MWVSIGGCGSGVLIPLVQRGWFLVGVVGTSSYSQSLELRQNHLQSGIHLIKTWLMSSQGFVDLIAKLNIGFPSCVYE